MIECSASAHWHLQIKKMVLVIFNNLLIYSMCTSVQTSGRGHGGYTMSSTLRRPQLSVLADSAAKLKFRMVKLSE